MDGYQGESVLVTGAAGFVGSNLVRELLAHEADVVGVDDFSSGSDLNLLPFRADDRFEFAEMDIRDNQLPVRDFRYIFHLACTADTVAYQRQPVKTLETCALGTKHILELARRCSSRLIFTSTSEVYGNPAVHPQREDYFGNVNPTGPRSMYDEGKRFAEALITASPGIQTCILRLFNTYGPGMRLYDHRMISTFVKQGLAGEDLTIHGDGTQTRSLCYVDDTVDALLRAGKRIPRGPINIGNPNEVSVLEVARQVLKVTGSSSGLTFVDRPAEDPDRRRPDIELAISSLDWRPRTDLRDGLQRYVASVAASMA